MNDSEWITLACLHSCSQLQRISSLFDHMDVFGRHVDIFFHRCIRRCRFGAFNALANDHARRLLRQNDVDLGADKSEGT